jgi:hypothetical protein
MLMALLSVFPIQAMFAPSFHCETLHMVKVTAVTSFSILSWGQIRLSCYLNKGKDGVRRLADEGHNIPFTVDGHVSGTGSGTGNSTLKEHGVVLAE